jgi:hypothetical protein
MVITVSTYPEEGGTSEENNSNRSHFCTDIESNTSEQVLVITFIYNTEWLFLPMLAVTLLYINTNTSMAIRNRLYWPPDKIICSEFINFSNVFIWLSSLIEIVNVQE